MILFNKTKNKIISSNLKIADNFLDRLLGLIPKKKIEGDECLLITRCPMIHTCFMKFSIDVAFLNRDMKVLSIEKEIAPWRFSKYYKNAFYCLEFSSGFINDKVLSKGDIIDIRDKG